MWQAVTRTPRPGTHHDLLDVADVLLGLAEGVRRRRLGVRPHQGLEVRAKVAREGRGVRRRERAGRVEGRELRGGGGVVG